ncbi:MAG TPA: MFS transporter [Motiliproteus sp.]
MSDRSTYWRLSLFYYGYFSLLGGLVPYWALYLQSLHFDPQQIGLLMAILMGTRIVAPNLWGVLADRSGQRLRIIQLGSLAAWVVFAAAFWTSSFIGMALLMFAFTFFWNAVLPQFEVLTLQALGVARNRYSRVRLWGSIGFIVAVVGIGALLERVGIQWLIGVLWALLGMILLTSFSVAEQPDLPVEPTAERLLTVLRRPEVITFFVVSLLVQLGHGPYYTFYSVFMTEQGFTTTEIGLLWALGVVAEVLVFMVMHRLIEGLGLRRIVVWGLWLCALRWLMISQWPNLFWVVIPAQLLHAVTFGCLHAASIALVYRFFPRHAQGQGQALYSSIGFGVGGALGAFLSGVVWQQGGGELAFLMAALVSAIGGVLAWARLRVD